MRRILLSLVALLSVVLTAQAIDVEQARRDALFLTDKMAYELGLNEAQYDAVYEINFDYLTYVSSKKNIKGTYLSRRNYDINFVLTATQYSKFYKADYFYTPATWDTGLVLKVYQRYPDRNKMYYPAPYSCTVYRGEHGRAHCNQSWYKGKDFKNAGAIGRNPRHTYYGGAGGHGHNSRPTGVGHGHTSRPGYGFGTTHHGRPGSGIGHGAQPVKPARPSKHNNNSGVGSGVSVGSGVGHGVSVGNGVGTGVSVGNGVGTGVSIGTDAGIGQGAQPAQPSKSSGHGVRSH